MVVVNVEQSDAWNGNEGLAWAAYQDHHDGALCRFNTVLARAAAIADDEHVLDIGCGCGQSTRDAARAASRGRALGLDLSAPMLERARTRAAEEGLTNVTFVQGDAQVYGFEPATFHVAISRFGAMFFADPVAAFTNIGSALRTGGRLTLVVWMPLAENEWLAAVRDALAVGRTLPAPSNGAPGPFGLAEPGHVRATLDAAGYRDVELTPRRDAIVFGTDADDAFTFVRNLPPVRGMVEELDDDDTTRAFEQLRGALEDHATPEGVLFGASAWVITARRP
jgi:SAM-dependent methyltransferase